MAARYDLGRVSDAGHGRDDGRAGGQAEYWQAVLDAGELESSRRVVSQRSRVSFHRVISAGSPWRVAQLVPFGS